MKIFIKFLKIIFLYFIYVCCISAEEPIPVDIISDEMQWDDNNKIAYAIGNAEATQGQRKITANKLIVYLDKNTDTNEIILIKASGNVIFTTKDEIATGKIATYDFVKNNIILENNVTLKKNDNIMKGEFLEMDLNTGISQINSKTDKNRVRMRFSPKKNNEENNE